MDQQSFVDWRVHLVCNAVTLYTYQAGGPVELRGLVKVALDEATLRETGGSERQFSGKVVGHDHNFIKQRTCIYLEEIE